MTQKEFENIIDIDNICLIFYIVEMCGKIFFVGDYIDDEEELKEFYQELVDTGEIDEEDEIEADVTFYQIGNGDFDSTYADEEQLQLIQNNWDIVEEYTTILSSGNVTFEGMIR